MSKTQYHDEDIKSGPSSTKGQEQDHEIQDYELHIKKDAPPRFSTIFETKAVPAPVEHHYIEAPRRRERGGVFVTWPIVILLSIIFLFETIIIFAYTSIGLYNQMAGFTGHSTAFINHPGSSACDTTLQAPAVAPINFAPNIVVGAPEQVSPLLQTVTLMDHLPMPFLLSTTMVTSSTKASSSSSSTSTTTSSAGPVVTVTPGGTATSVVFVTASADSKSDAPRPTSFVTVIAGQSTSSSSSSSPSFSSSTVSGASSTSSSTLSTPSSSTIPSTTSAAATASSTTAVPSTTSLTETADAKGTNAAFIGGLGGPGGH